MYVDDILQVLPEKPENGRRKLVRLLSESTNRLAQDLPSFKDLMQDRKIVSFIEMHQSRALEEVIQPTLIQKMFHESLDVTEFISPSQVDRKVQRLGQYKTLVEAKSALLDLQTLLKGRFHLTPLTDVWPSSTIGVNVVTQEQLPT